MFLYVTFFSFLNLYFIVWCIQLTIFCLTWWFQYPNTSVIFVFCTELHVYRNVTKLVQGQHKLPIRQKKKHHVTMWHQYEAFILIQIQRRRHWISMSSGFRFWVSDASLCFDTPMLEPLPPMWQHSFTLFRHYCVSDTHILLRINYARHYLGSSCGA